MNRTPLIAAVVVVALAALAAVLTAPRGTPSAGPTARTAAQVTVEGDALPALSAGGGADPAAGLPAPEAHGSDYAGDPLTVGGASGTPQVVVFLAHWCPHCRREVPALQSWLDSERAPEGVELVSVSTAEEPAAPNHPPAAWLAREGWTPPVLVDDGTTVADAYGLSGLPFFVLLDAEGRVVERHAGELAPDQLAGMLADLAAG